MVVPVVGCDERYSYVIKLRVRLSLKERDGTSRGTLSCATCVCGDDACAIAC